MVFFPLYLLFLFIILLFIFKFSLTPNKDIFKIKNTYSSTFFAVIFVLFIFYLFYILKKPDIKDDLFRYLSAYKQISSAKSIHSVFSTFILWEKGFIVYNYILGSINSNRFFFLLINSIFFITIFSTYITSYSKYPFYSLFIFIFFTFFFNSTNLLRQYLALCNTLIAFYFYKEKKNTIIFFFFYIVAISFHISSIFFIIVPVLDKIRLSKRVFICYFFVLFLSILFGSYMIPLLTMLLPKYKSYLMDSTFGIQNKIKLGVLFELSYLFYFIYKSIHLKKYDELILKLMMFAAIIDALSLKFTTLQRVSHYFTIYLVTYIPNSLLNRKTILFITFLLVFYYLLISFYKPDWTAFFPYKWVL